MGARFRTLPREAFFNPENLARLLRKSVDHLRRTTDVARGDTVVVLGREQSRVKPTDRTCEVDWAMVFTLRDGLIARFREYHDTAAWVTAYGAPVPF